MPQTRRHHCEMSQKMSQHTKQLDKGRKLEDKIETKKNSPIYVPGQGRHALARLRVPDLDGLVIASTCYFCAVWAPGDGPDPAVCDEMSQHTKQLRHGKKIRPQNWGKKNLTNLSARSTVTQFGCPFLRPKSESKSPRFPRSIPPYPHH